jgi:hypothetical protein
MLRADVGRADILMIQLMVAAVTDHTGQPDLWRRYLQLLLDGLRARPDVAPHQADKTYPLEDRELPPRAPRQLTRGSASAGPASPAPRPASRPTGALHESRPRSRPLWGGM